MKNWNEVASLSPQFQTAMQRGWLGSAPERWRVAIVVATVAGFIAWTSYLALPGPTAFASTILGFLMVAGAIVDACSYRLPNWITYAAIATGLSFACFPNIVAAAPAILAATLRGLCTALAILIFRWGYAHFREQEGLGLGDVKLAVAVGIWLPVNKIPLCFAVASCAALFSVAALYCLKSKTARNGKIPLGLFLCPALWLIFFFNALGNQQ